MLGTTARPDDREFTVGWVCALFKEYIAALEILDQTYDDTTKSSLTSDGRSYYTRGRIGGHRIVVGCLPIGRYGLVSTSTVAEDMKMRFPSINLGFMVGIGGGAPSEKNDVRLGDVVIGTKVVQYGLGKKTPSGFQVTGHTFTPAPILLHAVTGLKTRIFDGLDLATSLEQMVAKSPPMKATFGRPESHTDRLYNPRYVHLDNCDCTNHRPQDQVHLIQRPSRGKDQVRVHDGIIASADQVIKDATARDQIAHEFDALCFEMEAAGLSDSLKWIAIRGICDYSDSHKNDRWHGYAAAAAALCAKELLLTIPPVNSTGMERVTEHKRWEVDRADFMRVLEKLPTGIATTMHSALIGICVLLAIFGQLIWSFYLWPPMKQFGGAPIHINIHVSQQAVSHTRRQSEVDWFSTVQWNGAEGEKVMGSTAELLQGVRALIGKEIGRNISISIPHDTTTGGPLSPVDSSCDPLERRTDSVSSASKPPVPPRSKKPRGYVSRRNTQIPVPNSMARKNKQSAERKNNKSEVAGEDVPEIVALINEFRGRASMSAPGTFNVSGASFQGRFIVDGRELHIDGQFYQHIGQTQATPVTLTYEAVDDLHGTYEIDQGSSSIGPTELKIKALNTQEKTISLSGTITPPTPSTHQVSGALHIAIHE
ncbi:nucleoside phosphorylase domain-containing protein [Aspergillus pseudotamarii]|uniref:Nucleoside phosphorylase domain-containing protein n=1 Tax=Aspergillus pseudotamarii TaxID=132259 RepID=A0A5N6SU58_ASPPS|nr:nucleoside phosphorylase domain-containing protein [Aspergillus pseudotamarii]KAE8137437.1 nucleoside phosphorylase domain-containing protein [Aspergillus pseudotamarii]